MVRVTPGYLPVGGWPNRLAPRPHTGRRDVFGRSPTGATRRVCQFFNIFTLPLPDPHMPLIVGVRGRHQGPEHRRFGPHSTWPSGAGRPLIAAHAAQRACAARSFTRDIAEAIDVSRKLLTIRPRGDSRSTSMHGDVMTLATTSTRSKPRSAEDAVGLIRGRRPRGHPHGCGATTDAAQGPVRPPPRVPQRHGQRDPDDGSAGRRRRPRHPGERAASACSSSAGSPAGAQGGWIM